MKLIEAARDGDVHLIKRLLESGEDIEQLDGSRDTPLNEAARKGHVEAVRFLLIEGANPNHKNQDEKTALEWVQTSAEAREKRQEIIELLLTARKGNFEARLSKISWILWSEDIAVKVMEFPKQRRKLTEVFNFADRERYIISENIKTKAEAMTDPTSFDVLPRSTLQNAFNQYKKMGGILDESHVMRAIISLKDKVLRADCE